MKKDAFQLTGNAASIYEEQKVPAIFRPLALATLGALTIRNDDKVLDVACGTGIVGREMMKLLGPNGFVAGVDLNDGMIDVARELTSTDASRFEWHVADVAAMPFEADTFSLAVCQQGLQFFPNEATALREMKRVLQPEGRVAFTVWAGASEFFLSLAEALSRHVGEEVGQKSLAPFQYAGTATLPTRLNEIGFEEIEVQTLTVVRRIRNPETAIPKEILGNPVGPSVSRKGAAAMQKIVCDVMDDLSHFIEGSDLVAPQEANLITGKASN
jgi:SAM-dependent methyltransferase